MTKKGVNAVNYIEINHGPYSYIIPKTDKSLSRYYFFNKECLDCLHYYDYYFKGWLGYKNIRDEVKPTLSQRYLEYLEHVLAKELKLQIYYEDGTRKPFKRLEDLKV